MDKRSRSSVAEGRRVEDQWREFPFEAEDQVTGRGTLLVRSHPPPMLYSIESSGALNRCTDVQMTFHHDFFGLEWMLVAEVASRYLITSASRTSTKRKWDDQALEVTPAYCGVKIDGIAVLSGPVIWKVG